MDSPSRNKNPLRVMEAVVVVEMEYPGEVLTAVSPVPLTRFGVPPTTQIGLARVPALRL